MRRNGLSLRRKTTTAQLEPSRLIAKLIIYILYVRRLSRRFNYQPGSIIAMDETLLWDNMVSNTTVEKTGAKSVVMKTTGHEKVMVSVCLSAKADGTKPMIVFRGAKRESKSLDEEFKHRCVVASSVNAWLNEELTLEWVKRVLGSLSFGRRLRAWDSFECHMMDSVKEAAKRINEVIIPGGCTKYIQARMYAGTDPLRLKLQSYMMNGWQKEYIITQKREI